MDGLDVLIFVEALDILCSHRVNTRPICHHLRQGCLPMDAGPHAACEDPARPLSQGPAFLKGQAGAVAQTWLQEGLGLGLQKIGCRNCS